MQVAFAHPANARILRYLERKGPATQPEVAARLLRELTPLLPEPCAAELHGRPVLVHPATGIIFAFAWGRQTYALKLAPPEYDQAIASGMRTLRFDVPWILGDWRAEEPAWCLAAYRQAGNQP